MSLPVVAPGEQVIEMMIPASKVGLIIGKFQTTQRLLPSVCTWKIHVEKTFLFLAFYIYMYPSS